MDIHSSHNPKTPSELGVSQPRVKRSASTPASPEAQPPGAASKVGQVVRELTASLRELPEVREEMVAKGKSLNENPEFPNSEQLAALARMLTREPSEPGE